MKRKVKRITSIMLTLAIALTLALGLLTITASAQTCILIENSFSNAETIAVGQKIEVGGRQNSTDDNCTYFNMDYNYTFTVTQTCEVTFELSTEAHRGSAWKYNYLSMTGYCADAHTKLGQLRDGRWTESLTVNSESMPLTKEISFKVIPGTYYINLYCRSTYNSFGWIEYKSMTPIQDDFNGEPNDTVAQAQALPSISAGVDYTGNIKYHGKPYGSQYDYDNHDYYRFDVPHDGYGVRLTASRADAGIDNSFQIRLADSRGDSVDYRIQVNLETFPSGECEYTGLSQGIYYVHVVAWNSNVYPTEYTFRLDVIAGSTPDTPSNDTPSNDTPSNNTPSTDIPTDWAVPEVDRANGLHLVPDFLLSQYTRPITRAEFCALAVTLYELATGTVISGRVPFNDTNDVNVEKAAYIEVVNGVGDNRFDPYGTLTREQAATMLARLADAIGRPLPPRAPTFVDSSSFEWWSYDAIGQCQGEEIMGGTGNNTFSPTDSYTREQSIATILRMYDYQDD